MAEAVVLINSSRAPTPMKKVFIAVWEKTCDYLKTLPGHDTTFRQATSPGAETGS